MDSNKKTMKAAIMEQVNGKFIIKEVPIPEPKEGQVLVKMISSSINPSDIISINGAKPLPLPIQLGSEGYGM